MKQKMKRRRDTWRKLTNISYLNEDCSAWNWYAEVQRHLIVYRHEPLQARICYRAELWTNPITRHGFGYGNGNRAKRRAYRLWQEGKITIERLEAAGARPLHFPQVSVYSWQLQE